MKLNKLFALCGIAAALTLSRGALMAQDNPPPKPPTGNQPPGQPGGDRGGRGRFDPAEFQKRMLDGIKDRLGFKDDEWTAVSPLVQKVYDLRRDTMSSMRYGFGRGPGGSSNSQGGGDRRPSSFFGTPNPEAEALQKAIDDNAPAAQVKAALEKFRASKKDKEAKLASAQEDLRKVLSAKQEAQATLMGLLP